MPFNGSGTFVRTQNWTNDANNNLPISATKFDNEDNDFASGLSLCLTRDGQGKPSTALSWSQSLTINVAADGTVGAWGRTAGVNNPQLQANIADATGATLNLTTAQTLALAIQGADVISMTATGVTIAQPLAADLELFNGSVGEPALSFGSETSSGLYRVAAGDLGFAIGGVQALDLQAHQLSLLGTAGNSATFALAGNGVSIANAFQIVYGSGGGVTFNYAGASVGTISSAGAWAIPAATAAVSLTVNGAANQYAEQVLASSVSGQSLGLLIKGGTTAADYTFRFQNQGGTTDYLYSLGDGEVFLQTPAAATAGNTGAFQVGYMETPQHLISSNTTLALTDRGKSVVMTGATSGQTLTIPANASIAFPLGTTIIVVNDSTQNWSIAITTDTLQWFPPTTTGTRTLASAGVATLYKLTATSWLIWGFGLS